MRKKYRTLFKQLFNKIKSILNTDDKKQVFENFVSLSTLQIVKLLLPLVVMKYLFDVLGKDMYGLVAFATAFVTYFEGVVNYGFHLTATRDIALNRNNIKKISAIFNKVLFAKLALLFASLIIFTIAIFVFDTFNKEILLFYLTFTYLIGLTLFPIWFFQGMEKMKYITILDLIAKAIFTVLIFVVVKKESDYYLVPLLNSLGYFVVGIASLIIVKRQFKVNFFIPPIKYIYQQIKDGFYIFVTAFVPTLYNNSTTFLLGLITGNYGLVAFYDAANKVVSIPIAINRVLSRTFFPLLNRDFSFHKIFKKIILIFGFFSSIIIIFGADIIVRLLLKTYHEEIVLLIMIMGLSPFFLAVVSCYGTNVLLIKKKDKLFMKIMLFCSVFGFIAAFFLVENFQHIGAGINLVFTRALIAVFSLTFAVKILKKENSSNTN